MSEEESWFDSAVDFVSDTADSVAETASDTYDAVVESEAFQKVEGAVTHSLRQIEDSMDTDDDGSLLDEVGGNWIKDVPILGDVIAPIGEELGDFATDVLGTREQGLFSEAGTYDEDTSDADYRPDSAFQQQGGGVGQLINDEAGIGENDATDLLYATALANPLIGASAAALGVVSDLVDGGDDPYVEEDPDTGYHDYDEQQVAL